MSCRVIWFLGFRFLDGFIRTMGTFIYISEFFMLVSLMTLDAYICDPALTVGIELKYGLARFNSNIYIEFFVLKEN